ncbi:substrate-binding periplasmic protein [Thalassospira lucentensis]|uniref:substrate-binding periplasmic protein n=1 Tax=Thalassospira lucentensis TaxID=168935 RepID=UPI003AA94C0E
MKWAITVLAAVVIGAFFSTTAQAQDGQSKFAVNADGSRDCTHLVASGNPDYPPYLWQSEDGAHLLGAAADMVERVGELAGVEIEVIHAGSWGRVQQTMRDGTIDLIAGAFLTVPRMDYMDYFYPAFQGTRTVIWTRDNIDLKYQEWSDLIGLEGLTVIDNSFGQKFDAYATKNLNIREVPSLEQGLHMLALNRAEYLIYEEFPAKAVAARENVTDIRSYSVPVTAENLYLTMSHKSECNTGKLRGKIAQALFKLVSDDVMAEMVEANITRWGSSTN